MNTIREISLQNQQDFWAMLYMHVGRSILKTCGRRGEKAIRQGLKAMAEEDGRILKEACLKQGAKPNLRALYALGCGCTADPRVRGQVLRDEEQIRLWEVYTCPLANLWLAEGEAFLGNLYCEENQLGLMDTYTEGKGQFHVTKKLTCQRTNGCRPDNHCRFAAYYRAANVDAEQRERCFSSDGDQQVELQPLDTPREALEKKCIRTLKYLTAAAQEEFGQEGLCAVAEGLRALVGPAAAMMGHYAEATLSPDMETFVKQNLPVSLDVESEAWVRYGDETSRRLFRNDFAVLLTRALSLNG